MIYFHRVEQIVYLNGDLTTPIYAEVAYSKIAELMEIFADVLKGATEQMCSSVPYRSCTDSTFVIDIKSISNSRDISRDGLGSYINQSCDWFYFDLDKNDKFVKGKAGKGRYEVKSTHFKLKRDKTFLRRIVELRENRGDREKNLPLLAIVVYKFVGEPHILPPMQAHGNSKQPSKEFTGTKPSVLSEIREQRGKMPADKINDQLFEKAGGMWACRDQTTYPRNMKQIYNAHASQTSKPEVKSNDDLTALLHMRHNAESAILEIHQGKSCNLAVTLATTEQLNMLETFCTVACNKPVILGIDMTYNIGQGYFVTPTVIKHPMLIHNTTLSEPTLLGPTLIHTEHPEIAYRQFAGDLVNHNPKLKDICFLGSDRQMEIFNGFKVHMPNLRHVLCRKHAEDNIKRYLSSQHLNGADYNALMHDIFMELIECSDEAHFRECLHGLRDSWDNISPNIHKWFMKYQYNSFIECLIKKPRLAAGLGNKHYYNNPCESANKLLKATLNRQSSLAKVISEWQDLVKSQANNINRSLIGQGKYSLKSSFKYLEVPAHVFFSKSEEQRKLLVSKLQSGYSQQPGAKLNKEVSLTQIATQSVSNRAGHKLSDKPRKRKQQSISAQYCDNIEMHQSAVLFKDRFHQGNKGPMISRCYGCNQLFKQEEKIVGCVKTYRHYRKDGKNYVSTSLQNVYVHLKCLGHQDFAKKSIHICNYMHKILCTSDILDIEKYSSQKRYKWR